PQMLGSGAITGQFSQDYTYNRTDANGLRFVDELRNIDFLGDKENRLQEAYSYMELHIEQGPVLEQENISIGIVQGIAGFAWFEVTMKGASNHSGTTPMHMRKDSLTAATATIQRLNKWAFDKMRDTVLTVGKIHSTPGSINVIPKETVFNIDVRIPNQYHFDLYLREMKQIIKETSEEYSIDHDIHTIRTQVPVPFSKKLMDLTETICHTHDLTNKRMMSGAAHDAMYMTDLADTAM